MVEMDSVPYEVVRTETVEVERPLSWFDKIARAVFWIVTGAVVIGVASWMAKKAGAKHTYLYAIVHQIKPQTRIFAKNSTFMTYASKKSVTFAC